MSKEYKVFNTWGIEIHWNMFFFGSEEKAEGCSYNE